MCSGPRIVRMPPVLLTALAKLEAVVRRELMHTYVGLTVDLLGVWDRSLRPCEL